MTYRQRRADITEALRRQYSEGMGIRPRSLQVSKTTILRKLKFLGELSKAAIDDMLDGGEIKTSYVQFDGVMAFERTQCLPMTVSIAVRPTDGILISARAGSIPCNTGLRDISLKNYGTRKDECEKVVRQMLRDIAKFVRDQKNFKNRNIVKKAYDPLFAVNQKCMKLRASLSRLRRDFWGYTQKQENLQYHPWIFMAYHNGWMLPPRKIRRKTQKTEPKAYPTPDLASAEVPNLPSRKCNAPITGRKRFSSAPHSWASTGFTVRCASGRFGLSGKMGCPYLGTIFRRNDLKVRPGRVSLQWDAEHQCLFVFFGDLLEKKNV